jgi:hypothetical protein
VARRRIPALFFFTVAVLVVPAAAAHAYNHDQHQGMVALGYKAMVAASLEKGCASPIDFGDSDLPASLRTLPEDACLTELASCQARWTQFLEEIDRGIRFLRSIGSSLTAPGATCGGRDPRSGANTLGEVVWGIDRYYNREPGVELGYCGIPPDATEACSSPLGMCDDGSIYRFLAPSDHTGEVLGYWATGPDDDGSVTALGFKPTSAAGLGKTVNELNEALETVGGALLAPLACAISFFRSGDLDCLDDAKSLADDVIPLEELTGLMPVIGAVRDADALAGLWHFQDLVEDAHSPCDDQRGILYEDAGPQRVPDALDLSFVILGDLSGLTLNFDESTGPQRFNITNPGDGDQASCERDRVDWEFTTLGHTDFSPLDNLALYGWNRFATEPSFQAEDLGWPLHAIGDAVAPHHVAGTTGWGHRPFEDSASVFWRKIIYIEPPIGGDTRRLQYEQLRTILAWSFYYTQVLDELRAERPTGTVLQSVPVRALVTRVGSDTLARSTDPDSGAPEFPFDPTISVPYVVDGMAGQLLTAVYGDEGSIQGTRELVERGAGASAAFLTTSWRVQGETVLPPAPRCGDSGGFFECAPETECDDGCCEPSAPTCTQPCQFDENCPPSLLCIAGCCNSEVR